MSPIRAYGQEDSATEVEDFLRDLTVVARRRRMSRLELIREVHEAVLRL